MRCGPDPMISVDHVGKLFERISAENPVHSNRRYYWQSARHTTSASEFLPTPREPLGQGAFRITGLGSFVTFLAHQEK